MSSNSFLALLSYIEMMFCFAALCAITVKKQWHDYWSLGAFLAVRLASGTLFIPIFYFARNHHAVKAAYHAYFYSYWISHAFESILALIVIYSIFRLAMAPLKGLQNLGMLIFRWAAGISIAVALGSVVAPHVTGTKLLTDAIGQLQRTQSILTLCLLVFVCFAIRPMGLSYKSRIFGVSLGLGFMSTNGLIQTAWFVNSPKMVSPLNELNAVVACATLILWTSYFALPEPKRRMIVLPTTSPVLRWNQISMALGDDPGFVAVGGIPPELFAPAELEVMRRASVKMVAPPAPQQQLTDRASA
jgi:hypothetical protein